MKKVLNIIAIAIAVNLVGFTLYIIGQMFANVPADAWMFAGKCLMFIVGAVIGFWSMVRTTGLIAEAWKKRKVQKDCCGGHHHHHE